MRIKLEKKHYQWGLVALAVLVCAMLVFFAVHRFDKVAHFFQVCFGVLAPFIYGLVMAYLLCPIYNVTVRKVYAAINKGKYKLKHDLTIAKATGTVVSAAVIVVVVTGVMWMIIPGLWDSLLKVIEILPEGMAKFSAWVEVKFANLPVAKDTIADWTKQFTDSAVAFATDKLIPQTGSVAMTISGTLIGALGAIFDFFIGIVVCMYFLNIKDTLAAQIKKFIIAHFKEATAEEILEGADYTNRTFGGFISGKIIDSAIIGIICFICMSLFGWEYTLLISCIIGITNIIPFFGPFIGAIPSSLLLLMVNPMHCLYFIIFVFLLQQFDGNILGPKILGESTGIASFWVLFSVIVGGGFFGFIGMVLGIPVFAVAYAYCSRAINRKLYKKGFSTATEDYIVDKYRVKRPRQKKKKTIPGIKELTESEIAKAKARGQEIFEATLVEYEDIEHRDESNECNDK